MTAESTFQALRCYADVLSTPTSGFSCNNINKIWTISVNVFVDFNAVFVTIDGGCYSWLAWDMVACQASPSIACRYLRKPSVNTIRETKGLCSPCWIWNWFWFWIWRSKVKGRNGNFSITEKLLFPFFVYKIQISFLTEMLMNYLRSNL